MLYIGSDSLACIHIIARNGDLATLNLLMESFLSIPSSTILSTIRPPESLKNLFELRTSEGKTALDIAKTYNQLAISQRIESFLFSANISPSHSLISSLHLPVIVPVSPSSSSPPSSLASSPNTHYIPQLQSSPRSRSNRAQSFLTDNSFVDNINKIYVDETSIRSYSLLDPLAVCSSSENSVNRSSSSESSDTYKSLYLNECKKR